jgi:hypothetical protein
VLSPEGGEEEKADEFEDSLQEQEWMHGATTGVEPTLLTLPVGTLSHSDQVSDSSVHPVFTLESNETNLALVDPALVLNPDSSFEQQVLQERGPASISSTKPEEQSISSLCASALEDARDRSAEFEEEAASQHENRMTERTMEDQALAAACAEEDKVHNERLDTHRTELESINLQAGDSGSEEVEGEDPTEQAPSVSASEGEAWVRGNELSARNVSFASLPVNQREQTDCSHMSSNPVSQDAAKMFT